MARKQIVMIAMALGLCGTWLHGQPVGEAADWAKPKSAATNSLAMPAPPIAATNAAPVGSAATNATLKEIHPGVFTLGDITIDKARRTVSFPAQVNIDRGPMEYLLVSAWGKTYESIFRTDTEPYRIHVAMLLLGVKNSATNADDDRFAPGQVLSHPAKERLPGDSVTLDIRWKKDGQETTRPAGEFLFNRENQSALKTGDWVYNGSLMIGGTFLAEREGSIVSLVTDREALINNAALGHDNDAIWYANTNTLPVTNTPVEVIIGLGKPK